MESFRFISSNSMAVDAYFQGCYTFDTRLRSGCTYGRCANERYFISPGRA